MNKINNYWMGVIYGLLAATIWAAFPVITRFGVSRSNLDEWDMTFIRFLTSGILVIPYFIYNFNNPNRTQVSATGTTIMVLGVGAPYMYVIALGLKLAPVEQFAAVTPASMIVFSLLLSILIFKTKVFTNQLIGISIILIGMLSVGFVALTGSSIYSYLIFLLGGLMWATYTVSSRYYCDSALHATALISLFSLLFYAPVYIYLKGLSIFSVSLTILIPQMIYQGIFISIIALFFYSKAVFLLGATGGSVFAALIPALATIIAAFTLNEIPHYSSILGLIVISIGMLVTLIKWEK